MNEFKNWNSLRKSSNKQGIDWRANVGARLDFVFNGEDHFLVIEEVFDKTDRAHSRNLGVIFDNGNRKIIRAERLAEMNFCKVYLPDTFKFKKGEIYKNLAIKKVFRRKKNGYDWSQKVYTVECLNDGYVYDVAESDLIKSSGCPVCLNKKIVPGINDIATTSDWMLVYFKNKEDALKYSSKSGKSIELRCPICGKEKIASPETLSKYGFRCDYCSDKISFPNKLMTNILQQFEQLGIISCFKREYKASWSNGYSYDGFFIKDNIKYLIEMDGGFHYRDNTLNGVSVSQAVLRDKTKNMLAEENGLKLIRVDCNYKLIEERFEYIWRNMKEALGGILDFSIINKNECRNFSASNLLKAVCKSYADGCSIIQLREKYSYICKNTITSYLKIGTSCGLCSFK